MLRLCSESSCSYPGRSVRHAAFDVSFYHSVKLPAGATGLPSPGDIGRASRLISRNKTVGGHEVLDKEFKGVGRVFYDTLMGCYRY